MQKNTIGQEVCKVANEINEFKSCKTDIRD